MELEKKIQLQQNIFLGRFEKKVENMFLHPEKKISSKINFDEKIKILIFSSKLIFDEIFFSGCKNIFSTFFSNRPKKIFCWSWIFFSSSISIQNFPLVRMVLFSGRSEHPNPLNWSLTFFIPDFFTVFAGVAYVISAFCGS